MSVTVTRRPSTSAEDARTGWTSTASRHAAVVGVGLLGAVAWSGWPPALAFAGVAPLWILAATTRRAAGWRALAYFAGATWPIVPAAAVFFGTGPGHPRVFALAVALWLLVSALNALPWVFVSPHRATGRLAGAMLGLGCAAAPPLALIGLASPLAALGWWFPGTGAGGVALYVVLLGAYVTLQQPAGRLGIAALAVLGILVSHASAPMPSAKAGTWTAVPAQLGDPSRDSRAPSPEFEAVERLRRVVSVTEANVVVLPESLFPQWSASHEAYLRPLWRELAARDRVVLFGVRRANAATGLVDNLVLIRGAEQGEYAQHLPVPLSMYRLGETGSVPLRWRGAYTTPVAGDRAALLICWEQLLVAPMLAVGFESPDRLVGLSNLYFARGTPVASIQRSALQAWARLYGVPWLHAVNE